jgi:type IV secretion system protein VirB10
MIDDNKPDDGLHGSSFNDDPLADIHDHRPAQLTDKKILPQGVVSKNLKVVLYIVATAILAIAILFSGGKKKLLSKNDSVAQAAITTSSQQDPTQNATQLKSQVKDERVRQRQDELAAADALGIAQTGQNTTPLYDSKGQLIPPSAQRAAYGSGGAPLQQQMTATEQQREELNKKEQELEFTKRFQSNLVYRAELVRQPATTSGENQQQQAAPESGQPISYAPQQQSQAAPGGIQPPMSPQQLQAALAVIEQTAQQTPGLPQQPSGRTATESQKDKPEKEKPAEVNVDRATGKPYVVYEGSFFDTVLVNQLDGDAAGPVITMVTQPLYSHDHQHVLVPEGTKIFGEAKKIGGAGFGQQRRMAVVFHRLIMPDGYSVDLDQFSGLNQIGEMGLKDKVNNHYLEIFGASIALGVIAGAAEITQGGSTLNSNGSQMLVNGTASSISSTSGTILGQFMQIPPTITIRPGHRVKVFITQDMLLPAYSNHTINQAF